MERYIVYVNSEEYFSTLDDSMAAKVAHHMKQQGYKVKVEVRP